MEMTGEQLIPLSQDRVWRGLNDPQILMQCVTGCETIDKVSENEYKIAMTAAIGPVKAKFTGKLVLSDLKPPHSYSISFDGSGGPAGFAKGGAQVRLAPEGSGTRMSYSAKANVGGKLAQIGSRLIDGVAKKMADDFFTRFNEVMAPQAAEAPALAAQAEAVPFNPIWIVAAAIAVMLIIAWALGPAKYIS